MAAQTTVVATETFACDVGEREGVIVRAGDEYPASDAVVKAHPHRFGQKPTPRRASK